MASLKPSTRKNTRSKIENKEDKKKTISSRFTTELITTSLKDMQEKRPVPAVLIEANDGEIDDLEDAVVDECGKRTNGSKSPKKMRNSTRKKATRKETKDDNTEEQEKDAEFTGERKQPQTPSNSKKFDKRIPKLVTPSTINSEFNDEKENTTLQKRRNDTVSARRSLKLPPLQEISALYQKESNAQKKDVNSKKEKSERPRKVIGSELDAQGKILKCTKNVYKVVQKMTGTIGGNGHGGAIYGELTMGSMQKMVELMKEYTNFSKESRFIDVGCGLGKPNLHVAQDPQVEFSYGIEMEHVRWMLGLSNLNQVFCLKKKQAISTKKISSEDTISHKCYLSYGDITEAKYFDPFTHVYMFDIGFPPTLFKQLAKMFNQSQSPWLICYHGPKLMVERYGFNVELLVQMQTTMFGSGEGHEGYLYKRVEGKSKKSRNAKKCPSGGTGLPSDIPCDPLFANAWRTVRGDFNTYAEQVQDDLHKSLSSERPRRNRKPVNNDTYVSACSQ